MGAWNKMLLQLLSALIVGVLLSALAFAPPPTTPLKPGPAGADAEAQERPARADKKQLLEAYGELKKYHPRGATGSGVASANNTSNAWKLFGVVRDGVEYRALIRVDGKIQRYSEGQELPGDSLIQHIGEQGMTTVDDEGLHAEHRLHQQ